MLLIRSHFPLSHAPDTPMTHICVCLIFILGKENWGFFPLKENFRLKAFAKKFKNFNLIRTGLVLVSLSLLWGTFIIVEQTNLYSS